MTKRVFLLFASLLCVFNGFSQEGYEAWAQKKRTEYDKWKKMRAEIVSHLPNNPNADQIGSFIDAGFNNSSGAGQSATPSQSAAPVSSNMKVWVVIVGVADYLVGDLRLNYTDDDAYKMYAFYKSPEGGSLPDEQIAVLIDEEATRANVMRTIKNVYAKATEDDVIVFYFSGHGAEGAFITYEFDGNIIDYKGLLLHDELNDIFDSSKARYKYLIADACHSGSSAESRNNRSISTNNKSVKGSKGTFYEAFEHTKNGFVMLLSSMSDEVSLETSGVRQGIFSYYLLHGMKGEGDRNKDNIVTVVELFDYINNGVTDFTNGSQNPVLSGNYEDTMPISVVRN